MSIYLLLKAKAANIGEIRNRKGGMYKKVGPNKWMPVKEAKGGRKIPKVHHSRKKDPSLKKFDTAVRKLAARGAIKPKDVKKVLSQAKDGSERKAAIAVSRKLNGAWKKYKSILRTKHGGEKVSKHTITKIGNSIIKFSKQLKDHSEAPISLDSVAANKKKKQGGRIETPPQVALTQERAKKIKAKMIKEGTWKPSETKQMKGRTTRSPKEAKKPKMQKVSPIGTIKKKDGKPYIKVAKNRWKPHTKKAG